MSIWSDQFQNHQLWSSLEEARSELDDIDLQADDPQLTGTLEYATKVLESLQIRRETTDPLLVSNAMLSTVDQQVRSLISTVSYVKSQSYTSDQLLSSISTLVTELANWPPIEDKNRISATENANKRYSAIVDKYVDGFQSKAESLDERLDELEALRAKIADQLLDEQQRISETIASFTVNSDSVVKQQVQDFQEVLNFQKTKAESVFSEIKKSTEKHLLSLQGSEEDANKIVQSVTSKVVATDYGEYAKQQSKAALFWNVLAIAVAVVGFGGLLFHLFSISPTADVNIGLSFTRIAVSLGALGLAGIIGRIATHHRKEAQAAKRTDLAIRAVNPFIATLPDEEKQAIVAEVTDRIFVRGLLEPKVESGEGSLRKTLVALRKKRTEDSKPIASSEDENG